VIVPLVTDTVTGKLIAFVPSEIVMVVAPLLFVPMPIDVKLNVPVDAGVFDADTATDAGDTVTIDVSLLTAVNVPVKPFSLTVTCWLPFTPPNATLAGLATGVGDGVGVGLGVGLGVGVGLAPDVGVAVAPAAALDVDVADGVEFPPPPPHPTSTAIAKNPSTNGRRVTYQRSAGSRSRFSGASVYLRAAGAKTGLESATITSLPPPERGITTGGEPSSLIR
jgi:hypothetical protein